VPGAGGPRAYEQWADLHLGKDVQIVLSFLKVVTTIKQGYTP
jgi:hypothetical protein